MRGEQRLDLREVVGLVGDGGAGRQGEGEQTLRDVGRRLGITQERVRQLETQALERLAKRGSLESWREAA